MELLDCMVVLCLVFLKNFCTVFEQKPDISQLNSELEFDTSKIEDFYSCDDFIQQINYVRCILDLKYLGLF